MAVVVQYKTPLRKGHSRTINLIEHDFQLGKISSNISNDKLPSIRE